MKAKICGLRDAENIKDILEMQPDYVGFIFYPKSPRYSNPDDLVEITSNWASSTKKIGVFVNEKPQTIVEIANKLTLDYVQLHGNESIEEVKFLKEKNINVIKAFSVNEQFDFSCLADYENHTDYFLFDTATPNYGGSGQSFDWSILKENSIQKPFFLGGGLRAESISIIEALELNNLHALDFNSKLEKEPGVKHTELTRTILNQVKSINYAKS